MTKTDLLKFEDVRKLAVRQFIQFAVLSFVLMSFWNLKTLALCILAATTVVLIAGICVPGVATPVFLIYRRIGNKIGFACSCVFLFFVFFLLVVPVGWLIRLMGRDLLGRRFENNQKSYWTPRTTKSKLDRYFQQF